MELHRVQRIVLPILRDHFGPEISCGSWVEDIDYRSFPLINVRRVGGFRSRKLPKLGSQPVIELTVYGTEGLPETEELYEEALDVLYDAVKNQTLTDAGYLSSIFETMGATQFSSPFQDSWRIQGLIRLGIRPPQGE
ncbi:MAG: hypothetical protein EON54_23130 [Alcaligenaceae bacterium]|nr:MAG: hypothetical protein EON54_23130 [Alcaligenaceae bacterium]